MARTSNSYNCGCGYHTTSLEEAESHADRTGHNMTVLGTVHPSVTPVQSAKPRQQRPIVGLRESSHDTFKLVETESASFADEMRQKIKNGGI